MNAAIFEVGSEIKRFVKTFLKNKELPDKALAPSHFSGEKSINEDENKS